MTRRALITGITGQDGSYLAELLLAKGYEVHGLVRRVSVPTTTRIAQLLHDQSGAAGAVTLHAGDLTDAQSVHRIMQRVRPDEIYNLAAQSDVAASFQMPAATADITGMGALRVLDAARSANWAVRLYQAGSSEMFGRAVESPQNERTPFAPRSPYAVAKVFAHHMTTLHREAHGLFACNGMLFNHESPRRGVNFVTRKVTLGIARILSGDSRPIVLGNLEPRRDWGYAGEYVEAMWMMLQQPEPDDYVIATGETHSVQDLVETAFALVGLNWQEHVIIDPALYRPTEVDVLMGDASKAARVLDWRPRTRFPALVRMMLEADLE